MTGRGGRGRFSESALVNPLRSEAGCYRGQFRGSYRSSPHLTRGGHPTRGAPPTPSSCGSHTALRTNTSYPVSQTELRPHWDTHRAIYFQGLKRTASGDLARETMRFAALYLFPHESPPSISPRCGCELHLPHHEINVNADFLLAAPAGVFCT